MQKFGIVFVWVFAGLGASAGAQTTDRPWLAAYNRGVALYNQQQYAQAIEAFTEVLALDSTMHDVYFNRGLAYHGLKQYDRAVQDFGAVIRLQPKLYVGYKNRALSAWAGKVSGVDLCQDLSTSRELGGRIDRATLKQLCPALLPEEHE